MSFPPVYSEHSRALILGSWPSPKSWAMGFYYGHPNNRFWPLLAGLTSCGYVTRAFAEGDARTKFIELTPKGEQLCLKNRELMDKCDAIIQDALTEEEQVQFKELLIKIFNHIKG